MTASIFLHLDLHWLSKCTRLYGYLMGPILLDHNHKQHCNKSELAIMLMSVQGLGAYYVFKRGSDSLILQYIWF